MDGLAEYDGTGVYDYNNMTMKGILPYNDCRFLDDLMSRDKKWNLSVEVQLMIIDKNHTANDLKKVLPGIITSYFPNEILFGLLMMTGNAELSIARNRGEVKRVRIVMTWRKTVRDGNHASKESMRRVFLLFSMLLQFLSRVLMPVLVTSRCEMNVVYVLIQLVFFLSDFYSLVVLLLVLRHQKK